MEVVLHFDGGIESTEDGGFLDQTVFSLDDKSQFFLRFGRLT